MDAANNFLRFTANKDQKANVSSTWILPDPDSGDIAAFYTLAPHEVSRNSHRHLKRLSREAAPVLIIPWLGVDLRYAGNGFGQRTLVTALRHALEIMERGDGWGVGLVLDAYDLQALEWYSSFELFELIDQDQRKLFVSLPTLKRAREEGVL